MNQYISVTSKNIRGLLETKKVMVGKVRNSRSKCQQLAVLELLNLLEGFSPLFITNGPMGDVKGFFSLAISFEEKEQELLQGKLAKAGYSYVFYLLDFHNPLLNSDIDNPSVNPLIWKRQAFRIKYLFTQNWECIRAQAADKREFRILGGNREVRVFHGYRGDGSIMGRRALPAEDCRFLVNVACTASTSYLLEPFAGGGGIVYQAKFIYPQLQVVSIDIAPELEPGLTAYGSEHITCDAGDFTSDRLFDAIVTEVPFAKEADSLISRAFLNLQQYMSDNCRLAVMCAPYQTDLIKRRLQLSGCYASEPILLNRKGTDVSIILAFRDSQMWNVFEGLWERLKLFY